MICFSVTPGGDKVQVIFLFQLILKAERYSQNKTKQIFDILLVSFAEMPVGSWVI